MKVVKNSIASIGNEILKYPLIMRLMHLFIAAMIFYMLFSGFAVANLKTNFNIHLIRLHKQFGILIAPMIVLRFVFRCFYYDKMPNLHINMRPIEVALALFVQAMLYIVPLLMSFSGYVMSYSQEKYVSIIGFQVPSFIVKSKEVSQFFYNIHTSISVVVLILVSLHILGVLKHLIIDKRNIIKSMALKG